MNTDERRWVNRLVLGLIGFLDDGLIGWCCLLLVLDDFYRWLIGWRCLLLVTDDSLDFNSWLTKVE